MSLDPFDADDRLSRRFWMLGLAQTAHSIEEMATRLYDFMWIATERLGLPRMGMSATTFGVVNMGIIALLLGSAPFVAARQSWALALAWIAAVVEIANGTGHLTGVLLFSGYVPGAATAALLLATGIALLLALVGENRQSR
jgi:Protein of unknown function with HXXEE motif